MNLKDIYGPARKDLEIAERQLLALSAINVEGVSESLRDILAGGGKRLRPALVLIAAKACGYTGQRAITMAVAIELIHTASLIHDDVIDNASLRRGTPTINARWGNKISVLVGDHLYSTVIGLLTEDGDLEVMRTIIDTANHMTDSELTQILCRHDVKVTEEKYLSIIAGKTASLMSCACQTGAMLADTHNGEVGILADYGLELGMAFQIADDLLDLIGDQQRLGKSLGNDIREGRLTLPFIHAISVADGADRQLLMNVFGGGECNDGEVTQIREIVEACGGIEYSLDKVRHYGQAAKDSLDSLEESASRTSLAALADYVMQRARRH